MEHQTEAEKQIEPGLLTTLKKFSLTVELIHDTALMRFYQKSFFKEKDNGRLKSEYLVKSKEYEKKVDTILQQLWPSAVNETQQKLF